jgi:predicted AlkP superfamily pyrophosphatase or phosphodiesterase
MSRFVRYLLVALVIGGLSAAAWFGYLYLHRQETDQAVQIDPLTRRPIDPATGKPFGKLVVLVVFDQMRGDYVARWAEQFEANGFNRMKKEGVWFSAVEIPYACTSTGPGHASIATGAPPAVTGIIENEWYDRKAGAPIYCVQPTRAYELVPPIPKSDEKASRGTALGFSPERLLAETVGDKLKASTAGKSKVVSLSLKDRTAVLMGGKKPDAVYCFDTRDGRFHTDTFYRERAHPWIEDFNTAAMANRWFDKPWERFRPNLDYKELTGNPDAAAGEDRGLSQGLSFPHPMNGGLKEIGSKYYEAVETSPYGNELLFELVKKAIAAEKLGAGETNDLLCVSFSSNDLIGHRWGPDSWEVLDITLRSDKLIADLLALLDSSLGKDRYTVVITADHGVCPLPEQEKYPTARRVKIAEQNNEVFTPLTAALTTTFGIPPSGPTRWFVTETAKEQERVWPWIYLNSSAFEGRGLKTDQVADYVRDWLKGQSFIETAFTRRQIETESFEPGSFGAKVKQAYYPERCGDVIAIPKAGVLITSYSSGTNHGTPQPYDSHVPVLAIGSRIPVLGKKTEKVSSLIVAPILARALEIEPPANAVEKVPVELTK